MPEPVRPPISVDTAPLRVRPTGGYTAIEMLIAATIFLLVVGGGMAAVHHGGAAWSTVVQKTSIQSSTRTAIRQVVDELRHAAAIEIDTSDPIGDILRFRLPLSVTDGFVTWGARDVQLATNQIAGGYVQYRIVTDSSRSGRVERSLVREILDGDLKPTGHDLVVARYVDDVDQGRKGFQVIQTGDLYQVALRLNRESVGNGQGGKISLSTTIASRNAHTAAAATAAKANPAPASDVTDLPSALDYVDQLVSDNFGSPLGDRMEAARDALDTAFTEMENASPDTPAAKSSVDSAIAAVQAAIDDGLLNPGKGGQLISSLRTIRDAL